MLTTYFLSLRRFDRAENLVLTSLETEPVDEARLEAARRFYADLARYADDELAAGGLSREEVELGLASLTDR